MAGNVFLLLTSPEWPRRTPSVAPVVLGGEVGARKQQQESVADVGPVLRTQRLVKLGYLEQASEPEGVHSGQKYVRQGRL